MALRIWRGKPGLLAGLGVLVFGVSAMAHEVSQGTMSPPSPPVPPAAAVPPAAPMPPEPPVVSGAGTRIMIVERHGSKDGAEHVRTVVRGGKTFVFKTDHPLSDEEVERRIARAESAMPPIPPVPPVPPMPGAHGQRHVMIVRDGDAMTDIAMDRNCDGKGAMPEVETTGNESGKITRVRIRACGREIERHAMAEAIDGIRQAREDIAHDRSMSDDVCKRVLKELDEEIAKLQSKG